jgi:hypothetical protein
MESLSIAMFSNSYLEELLFMTTFMGQKTKLPLVADEDWFSTASGWTENPRNFEGYLRIFTAFHNLYVGCLFHDFCETPAFHGTLTGNSYSVT